MNLTDILSNVQSEVSSKQKINPLDLPDHYIKRGESTIYVVKYDSKKAEFTLSDTKTELSDTFKMKKDDFFKAKIEILVDK